MHTPIFHAGERAVQEAAGETSTALATGRIVADRIVPRATGFIEEQPLAVVSALHAGGVWITVAVGEPGFLRVPDGARVEIALSALRSDPADIVLAGLRDGDRVGMLFVELATRRRYRVNGRVSRGSDGIAVGVEEAYPNCPKYIQRRVLSRGEAFGRISPVTASAAELSPEQDAWVGSADTLFVGSVDARGRLNASHRGGGAGFVEVVDARTLRIPDYPGNSMYNTLGNFVQDARAGLAFVDFARGALLQLTGTASLTAGRTDARTLERTGGTGRTWTFRVAGVRETTGHHAVDWELVDYSPFNPTTHV